MNKQLPASILQSYHVLSIAVLKKILYNCLYMGYLATSNSEPSCEAEELSWGQSLNNYKESSGGLVYEKKIFKDLLYIFLCKTLTPPPSIVAPPIPRDHDFHNFESTLPEDTSTQVSTFLADQFLRRRFLKIYSLYFYVKF